MHLLRRHIQRWLRVLDTIADNAANAGVVLAARRH
jgi:2-keto-4-pentenoate hydratase